MKPARKKLAKNSVRVALMLALVASSACQVVAGVEDRPVDPILGGCALPTVGDANIRFANLVPNDGAVDLCVRPSGGDYARPVLRGGGSQCPAGFGYPKMSAPFAVPSGKIDVKVVKGGSSCKAAALSEAKGIEVPKGSSTTVVRMGSDATGEQVKAYRESPAPAKSGNSKLRVVHAIAGLGALDFGITKNPRLPTDIEGKLFDAPLAYGEATTAATKAPAFPPDEHGYLTTPGTPLNLAAAPAGQTRATISTVLPGTEGPRTVWTIGDPAKPFFPVRALNCLEGEVAGLETSCTQSELATLSFDIFNAQLYGPFALHEKERGAAIVPAIAARQSDVMCITAISRESASLGIPGKQEIIDAAKASGAYPYAVTFTADLDTKATDPKDHSGNVPADFTTAPCASDPDGFEAAYQCIVANCSTTKTPEGTFLGDSSCLSTNCAVQLVPYLGGTDKAKSRCMNCLVTSPLTDEPLTKVREHCMEDPRDYKHFNGATSSMVLSKYPIRTSETYVFPSTTYQRVVHYAEIEIEKDKFLDYYCAELSAAFGDLLPYYGHYAPDPAKDKWAQEQVFQTRRLVEYVKAKSGTKPAVISGDFAASREFKDGTGKVVLDPQNPEVFDVLEAEGNFFLAVPPAYLNSPLCTECSSPANPYNGDTDIWQFKTYVYNMPKESGTDVSLFFTDFNVPIGDKTYPMSDRWGYNTRVLRPAP